jgi:hypothetical protein
MADLCEPDLRPGPRQHHHASSVEMRNRKRSRERLGKRLSKRLGKRFRRSLRVVGGIFPTNAFRRRLRRNLGGQNVGDDELVRLRQRIVTKAGRQADRNRRWIEHAFLGGGRDRRELRGKQSTNTCKTNCSKPNCSNQSRPLKKPHRERDQSTLILYCAQSQREFQGEASESLVNARRRVGPSRWMNAPFPPRTRQPEHRPNLAVIPGCAKRRPGIHLAAESVAGWTPGSRLRRAPE